MSFDQTDISDLQVVIRGVELLISWTSSAPAGSWYQVYLAAVHVATTQATAIIVPTPQRPVAVQVGVVGSADRNTDFSSSLPTVSGAEGSALLEWLGGHWEADDLAGFNIYASPSAGAAISYTTPVAYVPAFPAGILDGAGMGPAGQGGAGHAAVAYAWESGRLGTGSWSFAVAAVDAAGNVDPSPPTTTQAILAAPRPPAPNATGDRLTIAVNPSTRVPTLTWLPSPPG
jgi:hypothetical protein